MGKTITMATDDYGRLRRRIDEAVEQMQALAVPELSRQLQVAFEELVHSAHRLSDEELRAIAASAKRLEEASGDMKWQLLKLHPMAGNVGNTANRIFARERRR
jgi:hypothetical protein